MPDIVAEVNGVSLRHILDNKESPRKSAVQYSTVQYSTVLCIAQHCT